MAKRATATDRGHPFPTPSWWRVAIGRVRDSMTDMELIVGFAERLAVLRERRLASMADPAMGSTDGSLAMSSDSN